MDVRSACRNLLAGEDIVPYDPKASSDPEPERSPRDNVHALAELRGENARLIQRREFIDHDVEVRAPRK